MNTISFGARVKIPSGLQINKATSKQLAQAINDGFSAASKEIGMKIKPLRKVDSGSIKFLNPDSFNKHTGQITEKGIEGFESINGSLGLTRKSTVKEFTAAIKKYVKDFQDEGSLLRYFDYFTK